MYTDFKIKNFKSFKDFKISKLRPVNLITGVNNVGKTNLLEALFLNAGYSRPNLTIVIEQLRGRRNFQIKTSARSEPFYATYQFHNFKIDNPILLSGTFLNKKDKIDIEVRINIFKDSMTIQQSESDKLAFSDLPNSDSILEYIVKIKNQEYRYKLSFKDEKVTINPAPPPLLFDTILFTSGTGIETALSIRYGDIIRNGDESYFMDLVRFLDDDIEDIIIIPEGNDMQLNIKHKSFKKYFPIYCLGMGWVRFIALLINIYSCRDGLILIDEIENGIHYSSLQKMWDIILKAAKKNNTQIFATTHSYECIRAAKTVINQMSEQKSFNLIRLEIIKGKTESIIMDSSVLDDALESYYEIR